MRIISIRIEPVARILAVVYSVFGLTFFMIFAVSSSPYLTLPFGVLAPLFHLNINLNLQRGGGVLYNLFLCVACIVAYGVTGWLTGAAAAVLFNLVSKRLGGIDAKYFTVTQAEAKETERLMN